MASSEYLDEVESRLLSFIETRRDFHTGRWVVDICEELLGAADNGPRPQTDDEYDVVLVRSRIGLPPLAQGLGPRFAVRAHREIVVKSRAWAGVPWFHSEEAAIRRMRAWIYENRPDIVSWCHTDTREAIAYRRREEAHEA